jgi:hypothetical protein
MRRASAGNTCVMGDVVFLCTFHCCTENQRQGGADDKMPQCTLGPNRKQLLFH